ncbi:Aste57867_24340 [Aphanomyces stellatus]|uniref:Aste57867_24340 protein n=1 Tax=Aphanomyces stellatus TaxID=120398 RepID=A0A485LS13_9STRA|nr:hypothetical protein As57867_024265 [Aphanomyces stellatus]VFU00980.1 Aste57867_24340 [Aphanomyces stellatus]
MPLKMSDDFTPADHLIDNSTGTQPKWNSIKLGRAATTSLDHHVILDTIHTGYDVAHPKALETLKKDAANPYAQVFPQIARRATTPSKQRVRRPPRPPDSLVLPTDITFRELAIDAPRPMTSPSKSKSIKPKPLVASSSSPSSSPTKKKPADSAQHHLPRPTSPTSPSKSSSWNATPLRSPPRFAPGLRTDNLKDSRRHALQRLQLDEMAHRLSKHERSGPTLKTTLGDDVFNTAMTTITELAAAYATIGDAKLAWVYRCFGLRALGDRNMQTFVKNLTLQFYSDAVDDYTRACGQFRSLALAKTQSDTGREEMEFQVHADEERFMLLGLDGTRVVKSFAAHAAHTSLQHAYFAVSEAKTSHSSLSMHIRTACEMLSIAYTALAWLDLDTTHLGLVHMSIDAAQHRAHLRAAISDVALERHHALESEWSQHRADFNKQAESFLSISKQAESLRMAPKDVVTLSNKVAASNVEKRAMAAVVQVLHGTGGNYVVRGHAKHAKEKEIAKKTTLTRKPSRRRQMAVATSQGRDIALISLLADKRSKMQRALFDEDVAFEVAAVDAATGAAAVAADSRRVQRWLARRSEGDAMDAECVLSIAVEGCGESTVLTRHHGIAHYVQALLDNAMRRVVHDCVRRQLAAQTPALSHKDREDMVAYEQGKVFFAADVEVQRQTLLMEIEACSALYAKRAADSDENLRKLCLKLHERAVADDAREERAYERLQDEELVSVRIYRPMARPDDALTSFEVDAWGNE